MLGLAGLWPKGLESYKSILEIRDLARQRKSSQTVKEKRQSICIVIIDDEKFPAFSNLSTHNYNITEVPDLGAIQDVEKYQIVLCDLMGVGLGFDNSVGGAGIIREIKKNYPAKYVIAYTGARSNSTEAMAARKVADEFLKKDIDIGTWVERLDAIIVEVADPYKIWLRTRQALIDDEVDLRKILQLESAYVDSIISKDREFGSLSVAVSNLDLSGHSKSIVRSLMASAVYDAVFG